jgi:hypothetical protein
MEGAAKKFQELFNGLNRVRGSYKIDVERTHEKNKVIGAAKTVKEQIQEEHWAAHLEGTEGLGVVPIRDDQCCVFAALDIDEYDLNLKDLNQEVHKLKLPFITCRTKSGGAHLYTFFQEPVRADMVRERLQLMAEALGYPNIEIFPKQREMKPGDVGNWINLPYFNANGPTNRYALNKEGKALTSLDLFVAYAESHKVSKDHFMQCKIKTFEKPFMDGPPCLQRLATQKEGFPAGTRNNSLYNVGIYLRLKYPDEWKDRLEDANFDLMKPPLKSGEITQTVRSLEKEKYFYKCNDAPICHVCSRDACLGRKYGIGNGDEAGGGELEGMLGSLQKTYALDMYGELITDDPPLWYMDVDGVQITLQTAQLFSQDKFIAKIAESLCKYPRRVRPQRWQTILKEKIENADLVEVPPETGTYGHIYSALKDFCTAHGGADTREEIDMGKVWKDDKGFLWFRHQPFWEFMVKRNIYRARDDGKMLHNIMRKMGATKKQIIIDKKNTNRTCWCMKDWEHHEKDQAPPVQAPETEF